MLAVQMVQAVLKDAKMRDHADVIQCEVGMLMGRSHNSLSTLNSTVVFGHAWNTSTNYAEDIARPFKECR